MITIVQSIIAVLLVSCIVIQHRASGLSATFGGSGETSVVQRRGAEKVIYTLTILLSIAFFGLSIGQWYMY